MRGGKKLDPSDYFSHGIYRESRKKPPIRKEIIKEITIGLIIDENMIKIMNKTLILSENQKLWKSKMVNLVFC